MGRRRQGWGQAGRRASRGRAPSSEQHMLGHADSRGRPRLGRRQLPPGFSYIITEQNKYKYFENNTALERRSRKGQGREAEREKAGARDGRGCRGGTAAAPSAGPRSGAKPRSAYVQADATKDFDLAQLCWESPRSAQRSCGSVRTATRKGARAGSEEDAPRERASSRRLQTLQQGARGLPGGRRRC